MTALRSMLAAPRLRRVISGVRFADLVLGGAEDERHWHDSDQELFAFGPAATFDL